MTKKLFLAMLLVFVAVALLPACSDAEQVTTSTATTPSRPTSTLAPSTTTTAAVTTTTVEAQEPVTLVFATTFLETDPGGVAVQHFCDYVEDETAGVVTFEVHFAGALGNSLQELGLVSSQAVDLTSFDHTQYADQVPLLNFPTWAPPDARTALDYFNYLVFENDDTAALIQAEAAAHNIHYLGFVSGGPNVFVSKSAFSKLSDLVGVKFGAGGSIAAFEALGYTVVQTLESDVNEGLSSGAIDATRMSLASSINLKCYEVAKYFMRDGTYAAGNAFVVNLDTWDELTPETQRIMAEAAQDTAQFSLGLDAEVTRADLGLIANAGATVGTLSSDDQTTWWTELFKATATVCVTRAERLGIADDMVTVLKAAAEFTKVEWAPPAK
jgi:TRAP-type C4-dicarboxylate transport system substrate-binding protein